MRLKWPIVFMPVLFFWVFWQSLVSATEVRITPITTRPDQTIDVPIIVHEADNLAGIKLVMSYDPEILVFKKGVKTRETDSLMHIVNDRNPGHLIVVMAGVRGIKGKNFPIFTLTFDVKPGLRGNQGTKIAITEAQLMSDQLKKVEHTVAVSPITIVP